MSNYNHSFHRLFLLSFLFSWSVIVHADRACYWPDGRPTTATNSSLIACNAEGEGVSQCCSEGEACLSNGLCFSADTGLINRGACTDKSWSEDTTACPLFCTGLPTQASMYTCNNEIWCGNGTQCEDGGTSNGTISELYDWTKGTISHIANTSTTTSSGAAATSSSCLVGVCISTVKCLPISVPIGVGAGVGFPLALCVIVLSVMLKREKRKRGVVLPQHDSKESDLRLDAPPYDDPRRISNFKGDRDGFAHRDTAYKWSRDEYAPERHMLGGEQVHELGTHLYELPPTERAK